MISKIELFKNCSHIWKKALICRKITYIQNQCSQIENSLGVNPTLFNNLYETRTTDVSPSH